MFHGIFLKVTAKTLRRAVKRERQLPVSDLRFPCVRRPPQPPGLALAGCGRRLVGAVGVLRPLQLHLESLHADLEAVHRLDGSLGTAGVVEAHEPCGGRGGEKGKSDAVRRRGASLEGEGGSQMNGQ